MKNFDPSGKAVVDSDEFSNTYAGPDGSKITAISPTAVNIQDDEGSWVPIQTELETTGPMSFFGQGGARVNLNPLHPEFTQYADAQNMFTVARSKPHADNTIGFSLQGAAHSVLQRDLAPWAAAKNHLEYESVFPNTDLIYDVTRAGVEESLRLNLRPTSAPSWTWQVDAPGLSAAKGADGSIVFSDAAGTPAFIVPAPIMSDSSGRTDQASASPGSEEGRADADAAVRMTLLKQGDSYLINLQPDRAWLNDPARVYPVLVDPTTTQPGNDSAKAYKSNGLFNDNQGVWLGNSNSGGVWRTIVHYNYEQFFGKQILAAQIGVTGIYSGGSNDGFTGGINDVTCMGFECHGESFGTLTIDSSGGWSDGNDKRVADKVAEWVRNGAAGGQLMLGGDESPGRFTLKHVETALNVQWIDLPSPGNDPLPASGATNQPLTPSVGVGGSYDPTGRGLGRLVRLSANPNPDVDTIWDTGWLVDSAYTVPSARLKPNTTYYWRSWVRDGWFDQLSYPIWTNTPVYSFRTGNPARTDEATASPGDKTVVVTTQPTFVVANAVHPKGLSFQYQFRVTTGPDATAGQVVSSAWMTFAAGMTPSWTPPDATALQDGGTYSWTVLTKDSAGAWGPFWVNRFSVDKRIGSSGPSPRDTAGPVSVNLANGNVNMQFTSPIVSTVGGPMGMSFSYNSQAPSNAGLNAEYFNGLPTTPISPAADFAAARKVVSRVDPAINFDWGDGSNGSPGSPAPGVVDNDHFLARWTGFIRSPDATPTQYEFGYTRDDGAQILVNGTDLVDQWNTAAETSWGAGATALSTTPVPITVSYFENGGGAQ